MADRRTDAVDGGVTLRHYPRGLASPNPQRTRGANAAGSAHATAWHVNGDGDRMRGHRARLAQLRAQLNPELS
jgi:hypothetical protein